MTKIVADRYSPKILLQNPTIWVSKDSPGPHRPRFDILSWLWTPRTLRSPRVPGGPFAILLETPTIWVSTYSPGPQQSWFDILGWLWTPRTLRSPRVPGGPFAIFVRNPNNMCVYRLPWTPAIAIWHFELTQDHLNTEDTEGARRSLCLSCSKPLQYGCLRTSLDPSYQDLSFWADSGPPGHWGCAEVTLLIYKSKQNPQKVQVDRRRFSNMTSW